MMRSTAATEVGSAKALTLMNIASMSRAARERRSFGVFAAAAERGDAGNWAEGGAGAAATFVAASLAAQFSQTNRPPAPRVRRANVTSAPQRAQLLRDALDMRGVASGEAADD